MCTYAAARVLPSLWGRRGTLLEGCSNSLWFPRTLCRGLQSSCGGWREALVLRVPLVPPPLLYNLEGMLASGAPLRALLRCAAVCRPGGGAPRQRLAVPPPSTLTLPRCCPVSVRARPNRRVTVLCCGVLPCAVLWSPDPWLFPETMKHIINKPVAVDLDAAELPYALDTWVPCRAVVVCCAALCRGVGGGGVV